MGNRGRQNVASFLTKDLKYDWRIGAEFFESLLIDHDVSLVFPCVDEFLSSCRTCIAHVELGKLVFYCWSGN